MQTTVLTYEELLATFRKNLRNGNWKRPNSLERALFGASLWYAKHRGSIVNAALIEKLTALIKKLKETKGTKIFKKGLRKAIEMFRKCEEKGVFTWAPQLKYWLKDPDYIFWLGTVR